ncbi:MAG: hypothetical protein HGA86_02210, partial [Anaerolineaceae bacterium]|nr:hypothetical protein [Anaerolineaceae bacterium]
MQLKLLQQILQEKCKLLPEKITVIGISGGADSLSMLSILSKFGYRLIVAHFDHQLRSESGGDAEFVRETARKYDIEFVLGNGDVRRYALENKKTIEEAARILRYKFLLDV